MLLKIVQGPNAGAEIVLAEGMTLSLGKGDACDILLADQSLADVACELEIESERVRILLPGGAEERLEPFHVKFLGETTAIAIGPEKGAWGELIWPTRGVVAADTEEEPESETAQMEEEKAPNSSPKRAIRKWGFALFFIVLILLVAGLALLCYCPTAEAWATQRGVPVEKVKPTVQTSVAWCGQKGCELYTLARTYYEQYTAPEVVPTPEPIDLSAMATELGLTYDETAGVPKVSGNFATRAQRLAATAEFYAAKPGVTLDLSDDESLRSATEEVLDLLSEGKLKVHSAQQRVLALMGYAPSATALRAVLEAIHADVPHVQNIDCTRVTLGEATGVVEVAPAAQPNVTAVKAAKAYRDGRKSLAPKMPVVGVVTVPYPCLVLKDGSRVTEGAEFGGFIIEKISADTIQIRGPEGTFEWRP